MSLSIFWWYFTDSPKPFDGWKIEISLTKFIDKIVFGSKFGSKISKVSTDSSVWQNNGYVMHLHHWQNISCH